MEETSVLRVKLSTGVTVACERRGIGSSLILIAGLGCDRHFWKPFQLGPFAEAHDVIIYDNRGIGESDKPPGPYSTEMLADDAAALLVKLGIDRAHVLGVSMGGMVALQLAARHPERVRSLVAACSTERSDQWMKRKQVFNWKLAETAVDNSTFRDLKAWMNILWMFGPSFYEEPERVDRVLEIMRSIQQSRDGYVAQSRALHDHDATSVLSAITCPSMVLVGKEDILTPVRYSRKVAAGISRCELQMIDDCGHLFMFENPTEFNSRVLKFFSYIDGFLTESGEDEAVSIPCADGTELDARIRRVPSPVGSVLICSGLTRQLGHRSSIDELADALAGRGWNSVGFDYRGRERSVGADRHPTVRTMVRDVGVAYEFAQKVLGERIDVVVARGFGARLALEALQHAKDVPFVWWAPILWLRTSLELRGRLHELRRRGALVIDGTEVAAEFVAELADPSDEEIRDWVVQGREHLILLPKNDAVVPRRLGEELHELLGSCGGTVRLIDVEGAHPHPQENVWSQIRALVLTLEGLSQRSKEVPIRDRTRAAPRAGERVNR